MYNLHVIENPTGTYGFVGSIPISLGEKVKPTIADIMGLRTFTENGQDFAIKFPVFATKKEAVDHAAKKGFVAK